MSPKIIFLSLLPVLWLASCGSDVPPPPDVSGISVDLTVMRFDRDLLGGDAGTMGSLRAGHPAFSEVYFRYLAPIKRGDLSPEEQADAFAAYREYPLLRSVDSLARVRFPDTKLREMTDGFREALRYWKFYLPQAPVPDTLTTSISPFELAAFLYGEDDIAAGLEFYFGPDFDYARLNPEETIFSDYLARTYTPEHFSGKLLRVMIDDYLEAPRGGRLIDQLIYEGKKLFLLKKLLPHEEDHVVFEHTPAEMNWLKNNETQIYAHLQQENVLYTTEPSLVRGYTQPAPYSRGMPQESPGGAVNYLGYRIVSSFVAANPRVSTPELLKLADGQLLLTKARYKPK